MKRANKILHRLKGKIYVFLHAPDRIVNGKYLNSI